MNEVEWLFVMPNSNVKDVFAEAERMVAADPAAAEIPDDEAHQFLATASALYGLGPGQGRSLLQRVMRIHDLPPGEKGRRRLVLLAVRKWRVPRVRNALVEMLMYTSYPGLAYPAKEGHWTPERIKEAYPVTNLSWLLQVRAAQETEGDLHEWLDWLDPKWAKWQYRYWANIGKLTLRQVVYRDAFVATAPADEAAAALQADLQHGLKARARDSGALKQDVRRLQSEGKALREQVRQERLAVRTQLSQARGDLAAARRDLVEREAAMADEIARLERTHEARLKGLRLRLQAIQTQFATDLAEQGPPQILTGRTVSVTGAGDLEPLYRAQVESLGGRLVAGDQPRDLAAYITHDAAEGPAVLEQKVWASVLDTMLIQCDGLFRKKDGIHGIAMAGFQVLLAGQSVRQEARTVSCGPLAGSLMAEYGAITMALHWLLESAPQRPGAVELWSDCKLLVNRLNRRTSAQPRRGCVELDETIRRLMDQLQNLGCQVRVRWVPREQVHRVDRLCASAYWNLRWYHDSAGRVTAPLRDFLAAVKSA